MKRTLSLLVICAAFFVLVTSAFAEAPVIVEKMTVEDVAAILTEEGYQPEIDGDSACNFKVQGLTAQILLYEEGASIQFHSSWINTDATLERVNEWNKNWRCSRAHLDDEGNPHMRADLDLAGGVTKNRIKNFIEVCNYLLVNFSKEVI